MLPTMNKKQPATKKIQSAISSLRKLQSDPFYNQYATCRLTFAVHTTSTCGYKTN
ncbi:hypothetical protein Hanom_Chr09g00814021 [Helianthus anomalus]